MIACARPVNRATLPPSRPSIAGFITSIERAEARVTAIFVEADTTDVPAFGRGTPKALLALALDTRVLRIERGGRVASVSPDALLRGRYVQVWYADSVLIALSDPLRTQAGVIAIVPPPSPAP